MKILSRITRYLVEDTDIDDDPVEAAINSISRLLELGGTYNFSGFKDKNVTLLSLVLLCVTLGSFVYVGEVSQWFHLFLHWPEKTESMRAMDCFITCLIPLSELSWIWIKKSNIKELLTIIREGFNAIPKGSLSAKTLNRILRRGRLLTSITTISFMETHVLFVGLPLILSIFLDKNYFPEIPGEFIGLNQRLVSPNFELSYLFVSFGVWFSAINVSGYTIIFFTFMSHILGHIYGIIETLQSLRDRLEENMFQNEEVQNREDTEKLTLDTLKFCIQRHQYVLNFHAKFADMYNAIFGFHFLLMTIISVTTIQTMSDWGILNTAISASVSFMPLIMYCFGGEMVISANNALAYAVYDSRWDLMNKKHAKIILFTLCNAQRPMIFTAGNMIILDVQTFGSVMQTVYKVYAIIR